jgi:glutathione S-transferase
VLDIDGQRFSDSRVIAQELERRFPEPALMPREAGDRAQVQILQDWADESLYWYELHFRVQHDAAWSGMLAGLTAGRPSWERAMVAMVLRPRLKRALRAQGMGRAAPEQVESRFWMLMSQLDAMLAGRQWLVGERKTVADIAVASQLLEVARTTDVAAQWAQRPHLHRWLLAV